MLRAILFAVAVFSYNTAGEGVHGMSQPATAFGDSLTVGVGASSSPEAWVNKFSSRYCATLSNLAVSGSQIPDQADAIYATASAADGRYLWLTGFNDARFFGLSGIALRVSSAQSLAAWLAIPEANKARGQNLSRWSYGGAWSNGVAYGGNLARFSASANATASITLNGSSIYIATTCVSGGTGVFGLTVDGISQGSFNCFGNGVAYSGRAYHPRLLRVAGLTNTAHTVVVTNTNGGNVFVDWAAASADIIGDNQPVVLVGNSLRMTTGGYAAGTPFNNGSDSIVAAYNSSLSTAVSELASDGLDVRLVNACAAYFPENGHVSGDSIHPNDAGYTAISNAFKKSMRP